uniref:Uncharacterized protein n=1 Tax=viral metagenome TaxID=1070528 RepID=A0A6H1ZU01_9ZZZZ
MPRDTAHKHTSKDGFLIKPGLVPVGEPARRVETGEPQFGKPVFINGIPMRSPVPEVAATCKGNLLIIGSAPCVRDDLKRFDKTHRGDRMAVNDPAMHYTGSLEHLVSMHHEYFHCWLDFRYGHNYGNGKRVMTHSYRAGSGVDVAWSILNVGGTSGLYACMVGLALGYERIILAGMPMDNSGHYFDLAGPLTDFEHGNAIATVWKESRNNYFKDRVRSLSGRTREWLGEPNAGWLGYAWPPKE